MNIIQKSFNKVIFLDRDGVINHDSPDYIKGWDEFKFIPGSIKAIRNLTEHGFKVILITNQSAVNRGMISSDELQNIHELMTAEIRAGGGEITDIFFCPHRPDENCSCRKPKPGMILEAQKKYRIDLKTAFMIGDSAKDIECGLNAGCAQTILVMTGNGKETEKALAEKNIYPGYKAENLLDASDYIISMI